MQLDLRRPTIVIAGSFNPAIFTPQWTAAVIHDIPDGTDVEVTMVADSAQQTLRAYINGIGIAVEPERLTCAWDDLGTETVEIVETLLRRIAQSLPHTPANGAGVNFAYQATDFDAEVADMLTPRDDPTQIGVVEITELKSKIIIDDCTLNLARSIVHNSLRVNFNFHHSIDRITMIENIFDGHKILSLLHKSKSILQDIYDLDTDHLEFLKALN